MLGTKPKPRTERRDWFRVIRRPTSDEWGEYEIVDPNGKHIESDYDLEEALEAARYMNECLRTRAA